MKRWQRKLKRANKLKCGLRLRAIIHTSNMLTVLGYPPCLPACLPASLSPSSSLPPSLPLPHSLPPSFCCHPSLPSLPSLLSYHVKDSVELQHVQLGRAHVKNGGECVEVAKQLHAEAVLGQLGEWTSAEGTNAQPEARV